MIIPYNKKQQRFLLIYAVILIVLSVTSLVIDPKSIGYINLIFGLVALTNYLLRRYCPYGVIDENAITKGLLFKKSIPLDKIERVKMFAGDIKIYSHRKMIVFDKNQIDKSVLPEVQEYFRDWILK